MGKLIASIVLVLAAETSQASSLLYVGVGVIHTKVDNAFNFSNLFNISDTSWKAIIGLQPARNWGVEASYIDLGSGHTHLSHGTATVDGGAFTLFGIGFLPLPAAPVDLYAKAGAARNSVTAHSYTLPFGVPELSDDSTHFAFGGGVRVHLGKISARLEYEQFPLSGSNNGVKVASLAATYALW
jgi:opacity protein-like surface antigen